jgi:endonuclease/exonuclease/phosphatase family metal-dependent hydrolase
VHASTEDKDDDMKDSFFEELEEVFDQFPRYHMNILMGDFNVQVGREDIFKLIIGNEDYMKSVMIMESSNIFCNFKKSNCQEHNIHKHTWTSPDGVTHNHIDHVLIDKRQHSIILDVQSFRGADCDTDHYLEWQN